MWNWFKDKFLRRPIMEMTFGELVDKRSIFKVKMCRDIATSQHKKQISRIDNWLFKYMVRHLSKENRARVVVLASLLYDCNNKQFDFEDQVIALGGNAGLDAAKNSRKYNQRRAALKQEIDKIFGEKYLEVKKYVSDKQS